jgi:hypothetical protein
MKDIDREERSDSLRIGIRATLRRDARPPCLRVDWIEWDSGFRGSGLRVGDDIIAVNGVAIDGSPAARAKMPLVGQANEPSAWQALQAKDGDSQALTVRRRRMPGDGWDQLDIAGTLRAERTYLRNGSDRILGIGGPVRLSRDDFPSAWTSWYDGLVFDWERQIDRGVWSSTQDSRRLLASHMAEEPRVRFLVEHYPGLFADAVLADWEAVRTDLSGRRYEVAPAGYAYREDDDRLVAAVTAAAQAEWESFQADRAADTIAFPPKLDLVAGDASKYAGKLLLLPPANPRGWISNSGVTMVSWFVNGGWVFTPLQAPALDSLWQAQIRYRRNISPDIADSFATVGRILPQPRMVVPTGAEAVIGLEIEPLAALMGQGDALMFVDMSAIADGIARFAGEEAARVLPSALPPDDASPRQVLEALFDALHARDVKTWFALFADWQSYSDGDEAWYYPYDPYPEANRDNDWARSREVVLERSFALRVAWVDEPRTVVTPPGLGLPVIEKVNAEIDHVGQFDDEFRAFNLINVHRQWTLGRRNGGPWRITSFQGI